jgi:ribosomal protein S18 acetylase RimI-like enzyme
VAPMTGHRLLPGSDPRLRVVPWRGDTRVAHITPGRGRPTLDAVHRTVEDLAAAGYTSVLTGALAAPDQAPFLRAGFELHERLHLLVRQLDDLPRTAPASLRRAHHADRPAVLAVDAAAFPPFWRLDASGLADALAATPSARFRVATGEGRAIVGYAVTGRAGPRGYLQRLAVDPGHQRSGFGAALVVDGLRWLRRWGAKEVLVNTQEQNEPAVRLYEALGFQLRRDGLAVLRLALGEAS